MAQSGKLLLLLLALVLVLLVAQDNPDGRSIYAYFIAPMFKKLFRNPLESVLESLFALFLGGLWETIWLLLLTSPYMKISIAQEKCQDELRKQGIQNWRLLFLYWVYALIRCFMRLWGTGKWIAIVSLAFMEMGKGESLFWNLKIPIPSIIITWGVTAIPYIYFKLQGLWRQPSRRHRHQEPCQDAPSSSMELT